MTEHKLGELTLPFPSTWNECTLDQLLKIRATAFESDICKTLSILSGIDYDLIYDAEPSEDEWQLLLESLAWTINIPVMNDYPCPDSVTLDGKVIQIPKQMGRKTVGQRDAFEMLVINIYGRRLFLPKEKMTPEEIEQAQKDKTLEAYSKDADGNDMFGVFQKTDLAVEGIPIALAVYLQPMITEKKFDVDTIATAVETVKKLTLPEAFGIANFFLIPLLQSLSTKTKL